MSKKFSKNFDIIFEDINQNIPIKENVVGKIQSSSISTVESDTEIVKVIKKNKNFLTSLDALLDFENVIGEQAQTIANKPHYVEPTIGLDNLIRRTSNQTEEEVDYNATKRISILFDVETLNQLKAIAKNKNKFLKDVVKEAMDNYLKELGKNN